MVYPVRMLLSKWPKPCQKLEIKKNALSNNITSVTVFLLGLDKWDINTDVCAVALGGKLVVGVVTLGCCPRYIDYR